MSYTPIDFKNDVAPYLEADNMNHIQQGAILAVDRSRHADEIAINLNKIYEDGELNGKDGDVVRRAAQGRTHISPV